MAEKFAKRAENQSLTKVEEAVAQALLDLENSASDLKKELSGLKLHSVKEVQVNSQDKKGKNVLLVIVNYSSYVILKKYFKKIVGILEKKLKTPVLFIAKRVIQSKWVKENKTQKRPISRTLTAVHDAILDDLVQPATIIGKRIRHKADGSMTFKITLDQNEKELLEDKVDSICTVYKKLTTKDLSIEFAQELPFYVIAKRKTK